MKKLKAIPRFVTEIASTAILYLALLVLWYFILEEYVVISNQGLSTIGLALSTSVGVLTAIVVSFVLVIWQWSREARSAAFWRWRNALEQLVKFVDAKRELLWDVWDVISKLTLESAAVTLITPMSRATFKELFDKVHSKMAKSDKEPSVEPSEEEAVKQQAYMYMSSYLHVLTTANFEHRISHDAYNQILRLEGLLYRLLAVLSASVLTVAVSVTTTSIRISGVFNAPLVAILLVWFVYVLVQLGREIRALVFLEKQFREEVLSRG